MSKTTKAQEKESKGKSATKKKSKAMKPDMKEMGRYMMKDKIEKKQITTEDRLAILERLLPKVDINQRRSSEDNETLLHIAIKNKRVECVELLLKKGANVEVLTKKSWYNEQPYLPIHLAVKRNSTAIVNLLLDSGADIHCSKSGPPALFFAGSIEMATLLLDRRAHLHTCDSEGRNVLFFKHDYDLTQLYVDRGCNVNAVCKKGMTPLMKAVTQIDLGFASNPNENKFSTLNCFLEKGAEINATDLQGNTALHHTFAVNGYIWHSKGIIELLTLLLSKGADVLITNNYGHSPRNTLNYYCNRDSETYRTIRDFFLAAEEEARRNPGYKRPRLEDYQVVPSSPPHSSSSSSSSSLSSSAGATTAAMVTSQKMTKKIKTVKNQIAMKTKESLNDRCKWRISQYNTTSKNI